MAKVNTNATSPAGTDAEALEKSLTKLGILSKEFNDYSKMLIDSVNEFGGDVGKREALKSFKSLYNVANQFKYEQEGTNRLSKKEIENNITRIVQDKARLELARDKGLLQGKELEEAESVLETSDKILESAKKRLELENEIQGKIGVYGTLIKGISQIPIIGGLIDSKNIIDKMYDTADAGGSSFKVLLEGIGATASEIADKFKDPTVALVYLAQAGLKADDQITKLAKSLTQTKNQAEVTRENLAEIARASGDNFITTEKLVESTMKLGQQLGIAQTFSGDLTKEFTTLTGKMGLSEESAGGLAKLTLATGKNARAVTTEALSTAQALEAQNGLQLDNKQILEEVGKVSGQLLANFSANPSKIAAAVTQAKLLGTTLEQTKQQGESLLEFQTSIQNELQAEIISGQQLNLERARGAALMGDQTTLMKELANQNLSFSKFSQMNVVAQKNIAAALGLSTDALSDQLLKQQYMGKSRKEVAALAGEEVAQRLEALTAQDKFNNAVEKLQDIFVSLIDGPIGQFLDLLTNILGIIGKIGSALSKAIPAPLLKILVGAGAGLAVSGGNPIGALVGGLLAAGSVAFNKTQGDDISSNYGERTLITPKGAYALNNNDQVFAGTNLIKGDDVYSGPKGSLSLNNKDVVDAISALGNRIDQLSDRPVVARPSDFTFPITIKQLQNVRRSV
jgi:hypothetical protein